MASSVDRLAIVAIPYLAIEYIFIYIFSGNANTTNDTGWQAILNFFVGIFAGIGGYFSSQFPTSIFTILITIHVIMLGIFGAWVYQTINPV